MRISFTLFGTSTLPKEISKITGIKPDVALERGERNPILVLPRENLWSVETHIESEDIAQLWQDLEKKLITGKEEIRLIAKTGRVIFTIVVDLEYPGRLPSIIIPVSMSAFAAYVNAVIDIDHLQ